MAKSATPLQMISVASPCRVSWDGMDGDDRVRFCTSCSSRVYNLSGMTREEAERLVVGAEGRLCVRFYRRADGTVATRDCSLIFGLSRRVVTGLAALAAVVLLGIFGTGLAVFAASQIASASGGGRGPESAGWTSVPPVRMIRDWLFPPPPPVVMGGICPPPQVQPPPPEGNP
jgi:hypothetical protein